MSGFYAPNVGYAAVASKQHFVGGAIGDVDFTKMSAGANATLPTGTLAGGLTFARATGTAASETVQTGTSTVVTTGITLNVARCGRRLDADSLALVFEESRINLFIRSRDISPGIGLTAGVTTVYTTGQSSPDGGTSGIRVQITSGGYSNYYPAATTTYLIGSQWIRQGAGTGAYQMILATNATTGAAVFGTAGASWSRVITPAVNFGATTPAEIPGDGRDQTALTGGAGTTAGNRDYVVDMIQYEQGQWASEFILTAGASATRNGERLSVPAASTVVVSGRLYFSVSLRPKAAQSKYAAAVRLWTSGADYCEIAPATGVLTVSIGGVTNTTAAITAWAQYDAVDIYVAAGGSVATVVGYRINGGAVTKPAVAGAVLGNVSTAGALDVLCNATASQFSAWVTGIAFWNSYTTPWGI